MIVLKVAPWLYRIFVVFIILIATLPFKLRFISVLGKQISYADILLVLITVILFPLFFKKQPFTKSAYKSVKYLYFILIYAFISTIWVSYDISYWYIFYQLALTFIVVSIPYLISKITNDKHIDYHKLISNFSIVLSIILFSYILRQDENERLNGYLGGAAILCVVMIPVLSVHFHNLLNKKRIISSFIGFFVTLISLFLTESRVGLVMLVLFLVVTVFRKPSLKRWSLTIGLSLIFIFTISQNISTERYSAVFVDNERRTLLETAWAWGTHSTPALIFGNGYGSIWQWAAFEQGSLPMFNFPWHPTEHGYILFHAHSIFNQLFAELGLIGTILFVFFVYIIIRETWISWRNKNELKTNILIAIICTLPTFITDLLLFRNWEVSIIWLFYVFTALNYPASKAKINFEADIERKSDISYH